MKQSLDLKLGQRLKLTPRLQQAIHLLQLSSIELEQEIQANLESNPFLEESGTEMLPEDAGLDPVDHDDDPQLSFGDDNVMDADPEFAPDEPTQTSTDWQSDSQSTLSIMNQDSGRSDIDYGSLLENCTNAINLVDHLEQQLTQIRLNDRQILIATAVVEQLNDDGYMDTPLEEMVQFLPAQLNIGIGEIESALTVVQQLEPAGVGARDLRECLLLQLNTLEVNGQARIDAIQIVDEYFSLLSHRDLAQIKKHSGLDSARLTDALGIIRDLDPRPAATMFAGPATYVVPDVVASKFRDEWLVELNADRRSNLGLSPSYRTYLSADSNNEDSIYFRQRYREAKWFLQSLKQRNETIVRVCREIVRHQRDFFESGIQYMKPLTLRQVADTLDLHESTISRATNQKFMQSPQGLHELKYFFSSQLETESGENFSSTAIQAQIRELIEQEPKGKPVSDQKISDHFKSRGIHVARRTVAKYREQMHIPPSSQRKSII